VCDDWDDGEPPDVWVREWRRARKEHECCACAEAIRAGERYHLTRQLFEGSWDEWKHCARCWAICEALWASGRDSIEYGLNCGELWERPPPEVERLAFLTREEAQALPTTRSR
jgi:hypothetical protein